MQSKELNRYKTKTVPQLLKLATKHFNQYIRKRDSKDGFFICISCGKPKSTDLMHAGHYLSAGNNGIVRFDERNVHGQCSQCNTHLHGNLLEYRQRLILKIGLEEVEALEMKSKMRFWKWDRFGLIDIILTYIKKSKEHEKDTTDTVSGPVRRMRWD